MHRVANIGLEAVKKCTGKSASDSYSGPRLTISVAPPPRSSSDWQAHHSAHRCNHCHCLQHRAVIQSFELDVKVHAVPRCCDTLPAASAVPQRRARRPPGPPHEACCSTFCPYLQLLLLLGSSACYYRCCMGRPCYLLQQEIRRHSRRIYKPPAVRAQCSISKDPAITHLDRASMIWASKTDVSCQSSVFICCQ